MKDTTFMIRGAFMDAITLEIPQKHNLTTTTKTRRGEREPKEKTSLSLLLCDVVEHQQSCAEIEREAGMECMVVFFLKLILLFSLIMLVAKPQTSEGNKKGNDKMHVLDYVYM